MKRFSAIFIILSIYFTVLFVPEKSQAQEKQQDVIYLNNGSILHGEIVEIIANESITLISNSGDKWVINQSDIKRIERVPILNVLKNDSIEAISYLRNGFYSNINIGFLLSGNMESLFPSLSLMFLNGYQFDSGLALGAGLGIDLINESYLPIIGDIRYSFKDSKFSQFVYFQGGYAMTLGKPDTYDFDYYESDLESKGGFIINPGIGLKLNFTQKNALSFAFGYKYMQVKHEYIEEFSGQKIKRTTEYNRVTLGIGFHF
jgi:sRNA-binding regulator protein Hfq